MPEDLNSAHGEGLEVKGDMTFDGGETNSGPGGGRPGGW